MPDFPVPSHISVFVQVLILIVPSDRLIDVCVPNVLPHFDRERYRRGIFEIGNVSELTVRRKNRVDIEPLIDETVSSSTTPCFFHFDFLAVVCATLFQGPPDPPPHLTSHIHSFPLTE